MGHRMEWLQTGMYRHLCVFLMWLSVEWSTQACTGTVLVETYDTHWTFIHRWLLYEIYAAEMVYWWCPKAYAAFLVSIYHNEIHKLGVLWYIEQWTIAIQISVMNGLKMMYNELSWLADCSFLQTTVLWLPLRYEHQAFLQWKFHTDIKIDLGNSSFERFHWQTKIVLEIFLIRMTPRCSS